MWRHLVLFLLTFTLDVRIHASTTLSLPTAKQVTDQPEGCLATDQPCALRTPPKLKWTLKLSDAASLVLAPETSVVRISTNRVRLLSGVVWIKGETVIETEFGEISGSEAWVGRTQSRVWVRAIFNDALITPRGSEEKLRVSAGSENELRAVTAKGSAQTSFPKPLDLKEHVRLWALLREAPKDSFGEELEQLVQVWTQAVEEIAGSNQQVAERALADAAEKKRQIQLARERAQREAASIRALFRAKNYLD